MSNRLNWTALALLLFANACTGDRMYEEFHSFDTRTWNEKDSVFFDLSKVEQLNGKNLIGIRFSEDFPFSNLYVRVISQDSSRKILDNKLINIPLFDSKTGKPRGNGFGETFVFYDTLPFPISSGTNTMVYLQYMRQENIVGIEAVGLKVLK